MRDNGLLSPQGHEGEKKDDHNGTIIPDGINQIWGTDATMFGIRDGSLLWLFADIDIKHRARCARLHRNYKRSLDTVNLYFMLYRLKEAQSGNAEEQPFKEYSMQATNMSK